MNQRFHIFAFLTLCLVPLACGVPNHTTGTAYVGDGTGGSTTTTPVGTGGSTATTTPGGTGASYSGMGGACPAYSSAGCCPDDGTCCDCVGDGLCTPQNATPTGAEAAFDECACKQCASECAAACAGGGIDDTCPACVAKAAKGACASQYTQCPCAGPNPPYCGVSIVGAGGSGAGGSGTGV